MEPLWAAQTLGTKQTSKSLNNLFIHVMCMYFFGFFEEFPVQPYTLTMRIPKSRSLQLNETLQMIEAQRRLHEQLEVN